MTLLAKCSLTKLILAALRNKGECDRSIFAERLIQQEYVNTLSCEEKVDEICFDEPICNNLKRTICAFGFGLNRVSNVYAPPNSIPVGVRVRLNLYNTECDNFTFEAVSYDENIWDSWTVGNDVQGWYIDFFEVGGRLTQSYVEFNLIGTDNCTGCKYEIEIDTDICVSCLEPSLNVRFGDCWQRLDDTHHLLPIYMDFACDGETFNYQDYVSVVQVSTPNVSIVKDSLGIWNLKVPNLSSFKNTHCGIGGNIYFGISGIKDVYHYNPANGDATYKFTFPQTIDVGGGMIFPLQNGTGDVAFTANKAFEISWYTDNTGTGFSTINRYDVNWGTNTLSNFDQISEMSGANYNDGFYVSLEAVSDDLVLVDYAEGLQNGGLFPCTKYEIREYDFTTGLHTVKVDYFALYGGNVGINDVSYYNGDIYVLDSDFNSSPIFRIRRYNYTTGALLQSSSPIGFSTLAVSPPGMAIYNDEIYIFEDYGNVLVYDATTLTYLYNRNVTNLNIRGTLPPNPPTDAISGAGVIQSAPATPLDLEFEIQYLDCNESDTIEQTVSFPCEIPTCCDECELDLNIQFDNCYHPYSGEGIEGGAVEVAITTNGCVDLDNIDLTNAMIEDTSSPTNIIKFIEIDGKWHLVSTENTWDYNTINISFPYEVCGVLKTYNGLFGTGTLIECCTDCPQENAFTLTIGDCYDYVEGDGTYIDVDYSINCEGWTETGSAVKASIKQNGVQIGTLRNYAGQYRIYFDSLEFEEICDTEFEVEATLVDCNSESHVFSSFLTISCELPICSPCVDCDTEGDAIYNIDPNTLCWSETDENTSKYEAVIPNVFICNGVALKVSKIEVIGSTDCPYEALLRDGIWYLAIDKACADLNPASKITLKVCWEAC